jgi:hypothetical protein
MADAHRTPRKMGRPSKGMRAEVKLRLPLELKAAGQAAAKAHGMTENDFYAALVAAATDLDHLVPPIQQEALPITA